MSIDQSLSFADLRQKFDDLHCWGLAASIDLRDCNFDIMTSKRAIETYVTNICELIDVKKFGDTVIVHFGEDERVQGYSMIQLIETSLVSGHFANSSKGVYIDIFSCKLYDPYKAYDYTLNYFEGKSGDLQLNFRGADRLEEVRPILKIRQQ